jgi:multidrug efflux system membrane fusion protein
MTIHRALLLSFMRVQSDCAVLLAFILPGLLLVSCSRKKPAAPPAASVLVATAETTNVPIQIHAVGRVQAYSTVSVRPQITGEIVKVHFKEGQDVNAGDALFTIDPRPWQALLNQAEANLKRDEAQMMNARLNFERTSNLFQSKIASQQDYDTAQAGYAGAQATVIADNAAITNAEVSLGYTEIRSPINGRTGNLNVKEGNVVKSPDDILVTITQVRPIYVAFAVPEQDLPAVRERAQAESLIVEARLPANAESVARGKLTFIDNTVDTNTGTILLKATFANADSLLWPGQFVQASLTLSNLNNAVIVPSQAVQTGQNGEFVFVLTGADTVEPRTNLVLGINYDGYTVIHSGIRAGEQVVTDGQLRLVAGAHVTVKSSLSPDQPAGAPARQP